MKAMTDLSAPGPVVKWSEQWWANAKPEVRAHGCTAHRKNGDRCKRAAIQGGRVCTHHGGSAPAVKARARQRIEDAADRMARELLMMAVDENVSDAVKLAAIRDALDRAGLSARTAVSVEVGSRPFEQIFDGIASGSRAESRRRRGMPDDDELDAIESTRPPALVGGGHAGPIVDAELIESEPDRTDLLPSSSAKRASNAGRRAYTIRDFDTSKAGPCRDARSSPPGGYRYTGEEAPGRAGSL
jgi:hypothetical protein